MRVHYFKKKKEKRYEKNMFQLLAIGNLDVSNLL